MSLHFYEQLLRILVAIVVGTIIGFERMKYGKVAGVRTHAVITVICTMLTMVSVYGFDAFPGSKDPSRLLSNILTGVGFLCGGVIFTTKKDDNNGQHEESVVGLTTAAGIFGAACLGIPIGMGMYPLVVITVLGMELALKAERILKKIGFIKQETTREAKFTNSDSDIQNNG